MIFYCHIKKNTRLDLNAWEADLLTRQLVFTVTYLKSNNLQSSHFLFYSTPLHWVRSQHIRGGI